MMKQRFRVTGMSCAACSARVQRVTENLDGVKLSNVNLLAGTMEIEYNENKLQPDAIIAAVTEAGYGAELLREGAPRKNTAQTEAMQKMRTRLLVSVPLLIILMYFSMGHMIGLPLPHFLHGTQNAVRLALVQLILTLPVVLVVVPVLATVSVIEDSLDALVSVITEPSATTVLENAWFN